MGNVRNEKAIKAFGHRLKEVRKAQGFTQELLSEKSGLTLSQIARIETGRINTTISTVYALAEALKIEAKELF